MTTPYTDADVQQTAELIASSLHDGCSYTETARAVLGALATRRLAPADDDPRHIIDVRADGWTIKHPLACRPNLFDCPVNRAAERSMAAFDGPPVPPGHYECRVGDRDLAGELLITDPIHPPITPEGE